MAQTKPWREGYREAMATQAPKPNPTPPLHQPPTPGGDPDQPSSDTPKPPSRDPTEESEHNNKSGFGHIGNNDEPRPEGSPPPHQIF